MTLKKALKWSALLLGLLAVVLTAVSLVFYLRWMRPDVPLPGTRMTQRSVGAASAGFEEEIAFARGRLAASVEQLDLPSISIAVGTADGPIWSEAVGLADLDSGTAAGVTTAYIVGSTAKAITSVLLARLLDRRAIDLDAPLSSYLSGLPADLGEVTARQLASHTAGVRHYGFDLLSYPPHDSFSRRHYANVTEALAAFSGDPLEFPPGSDFKYSTFGYVLLSAALEAAAGSSYPDLLRDEIARPLGLSTLAIAPPGPAASVAERYVTESGKFCPAFPVDVSNRWAGGGLVASPSDMVRFGQAFLDDRYISPETRATLLTVQPLPGDRPNPQGYALGWRVQEANSLIEGESIRIAHHGGVGMGGASFFMIVPDHGLVTSIVTNTGSPQARGGIQSLAVEIAGRFLQGMRRRPPVPSGAGTSQLPKNRVALEQPPVAGVLQKGLNVRDDGGPVESGQALDQNLPPRPGSDRRSFPPRLRQGVGEQFEIG